LLGVVVTFDDRVFLARVHLALRRLNAGRQCRLCADVGRLSCPCTASAGCAAPACVFAGSAQAGVLSSIGQGQNVQCIFHDLFPGMNDSALF
jgi:hypothetical protein